MRVDPDTQPNDAESLRAENDALRRRLREALDVNTVLREGEKRSRQLAERNPDGILVLADGRIVYGNPAAARLLGLDPADGASGGWPFGLASFAFLSPLIAGTAHGGEIPPADIELPRNDGRSAVIEAVTRPVDWLAKAAVLIVFRDVTERRETERRQAALLGELQHRIRNTVGVLRSIARRTAEASLSVEEFGSHLDGRIQAFARVQAALTRDPTAGLDLAVLVREEMLAYHAREGSQVRLSGPEVRLRPKAAETFGLALHELATNAVKFGALSDPSGRLEIHWRIEGRPAALWFRWTEAGSLSIATPPTHRGFGTELLERTLAFELDARTTLDYASGHLRCSIEFHRLDKLVTA